LVNDLFLRDVLQLVSVSGAGDDRMPSTEIKPDTICMEVNQSSRGRKRNEYTRGNTWTDGWVECTG